MASGCDSFGPTVMVSVTDPPSRSMTDTVPSVSLDTSPVFPSGVIAAPYGKCPTSTYDACRVLVSTRAAASARLSGTRSRLPSGDTASRSGHDIFWVLVGGKFCGVGADDGGGTASRWAKWARPVRPL